MTGSTRAAVSAVLIICAAVIFALKVMLPQKKQPAPSTAVCAGCGAREGAPHHDDPSGATIARLTLRGGVLLCQVCRESMRREGK